MGTLGPKCVKESSNDTDSIFYFGERYGTLLGLTISFSLQIPVFSGNEISFRNFGGFWTKFVEF